MKQNLGLILAILGAALMVGPSIVGLRADLVVRLFAAGAFVLVVGIVLRVIGKKEARK